METQTLENNNSKTSFDVYQMVTDKIIAKLENGIIPWEKQWNFSTPFTAPKNYVTGKEYTGINFWLLAGENYQQPYFLTYKQAKALGGYIEKGADSEVIVFWNAMFKDEKGLSVPQKNVTSSNIDELRKIGYLKYYRVFNVMHLKGVDLNLPVLEERTSEEKNELSNAIIGNYSNCPAIILTHKKEAFYEPTCDNIHIPDKIHFPNDELFYRVIFHELIHSTGHKTRLDRKLTGDIEDVSYAKEELIAELGSSYLATHVGYNDNYTERSAAYIQTWLKQLRNDKRFIVDAASKASKAVNYILGKSETQEGEQQ